MMFRFYEEQIQKLILFVETSYNRTVCVHIDLHRGLNKIICIFLFFSSFLIMSHVSELQVIPWKFRFILLLKQSTTWQSLAFLCINTSTRK